MGHVASIRILRSQVRECDPLTALPRMQWGLETRRAALRGTTAMGLICALGFTRCEASAEDPSPHIESAAVAHVLRRGPRSPALRAPVRTTDASIAVSNLSAQLHGLSFACLLYTSDAADE